MGNDEHVPIVNEAFTPTADEVAYWQELDRLTIEAEAAEHACHLRRREPGRGPRDPHRARRDRAQAARRGRASWESSREHETRPRSAPGSRIRSSTPTATSSSSAPLLNEEMLTYLEEMGGREVRDRYAQRHRADRHVDRARRRMPARARSGLEGDAVVVGLADRRTRSTARPRTCPRCSTNGSTSSASTSRSCIRR